MNKVQLLKNINKQRFAELVVVSMLIGIATYGIITKAELEKFEDVIINYECRPYKKFSNKNTHRFWFRERKDVLLSSLIFECLEKSKVVGTLVKVEYQRPNILLMTVGNEDLLSKDALEKEEIATLNTLWFIVVLGIIFAFIRVPTFLKRQ